MNACYHADDNAPADRVYGINFDASRSSSIYGSSDTVTPKSVTVAFAIRY